MTQKRVLIVDDAMDLGRLYQDALRTLYPSMPVTFVPSAEEALLEASRYTFDLMISDIRLPGMSGFDLVRKLRQRQPEIRVIMITGLRMDDRLQKQFNESGAQKLITKPVSIPIFLDTVREVLGMPAEVRKKTAPLRRGGTAPLPPLPAVEAKGAEPGESLSTVLAELRGTLGAQAVILLDDRGHSVAEAGGWPVPEMEAKLVPALMAHMSTGEKVSAHLGSGLPRGVQAFRAEGSDLLVAPVGSYALLMFLKPGRGMLRLALGFEEALSAQDRLAEVLKGMGLNILPPVVDAPPAAAGQPPAAAAPPAAGGEPPPPVEEDLPALQALEALLGQAGTAVPKKADLDDFWEQAAGGEKKLAANGDALTYDQALKLGLLPDAD